MAFGERLDSPNSSEMAAGQSDPDSPALHTVAAGRKQRLLEETRCRFCLESFAWFVAVGKNLTRRKRTCAYRALRFRSFGQKVT